MSAEAAPDLTAISLIEKIDKGEVPEDFVVMAAKGFLPLPQADLIEVLLHLSGGEDKEIAILARGSLEDVPPAEVASFARSCRVPGALARLAFVSKDREVVETVLRNRATSDDTFIEIAKSAKGSIQDVIVINQERVIRTPAILDALLENEALLPDVRRRVIETKEEFFEKVRERQNRMAARAKEAELEAAELEEEEPLTPEQQTELDELVAKAEELEELEPSSQTSSAPESESEENVSLFNLILTMSVAEKVQLAFKAGRTGRSILIKDRNKMVCTAAMRNPRISESEVESIAGMRNIESEVLRIISKNREWMRKYVITMTLVRNPKAPLAVTLPLVPRLQHKDLRSLSIDKNVPEVIRVAARRLFTAKTQGKGR